MANEAIKAYEDSQWGSPIQDYAVADATAIPKGTLCKLTSPRTAIASSGAQDVLAGITGRDKIASDGRTSTPIYKKGYFFMTAGAAIAVGAKVGSSGAANKVITATGTGAAVLGYAEQAAAADNDRILVRVDL